MLVCEQAEAQAREPGGRAGHHRDERRLAPGRDRHRRRPTEGAVRPAGDRHRRDRGRHRQGLGPVDLRRRSRRGGARGQGQRPADRRRRPRDGGGADPAAGRARAVPRLHQRAARRRRRESRAATGRCCSTRCSPRAESRARCAMRSTPPGPTAPAGRARASPPGRCGCSRPSIVGDGHVRGIACGDDGKSFKWIAFRSAGERRSARRCSRPPPTRAGGSPGRSSATSGTAAMRPRCTSRTPRLLDAFRAPRLTGDPPSPAPSSSGLGRRPFTAKTRVRVPLGSPSSSIGETGLLIELAFV